MKFVPQCNSISAFASVTTLMKNEKIVEEIPPTLLPYPIERKIAKGHSLIGKGAYIAIYNDFMNNRLSIDKKKQRIFILFYFLRFQKVVSSARNNVS